MTFLDVNSVKLWNQTSPSYSCQIMCMREWIHIECGNNPKKRLVDTDLIFVLHFVKIK